jgi:quercetin dioxygenase-like cupin family protein
MYSRRNLAAVLPALLAGSAAAQKTPLGSRMLKYEDLMVRTNGANRQRAILSGPGRTGFDIGLHETELAPGLAPHASHHHVHEEMILIREGTLEVTIAGKSTTLGPGSVAYVASNEEHGWRNVGETRARYFVLALGREGR